jgi:predicted O-methyltransferase YrrM
MKLRHRVTHRLPLSVRRLPFRTADRWVAELDSRRLRTAYPEIAGAQQRQGDDAALRSIYDRYTTEVSNWEWAVSWPTARALDRLCEQLRPRHILDLGSGLSTYVVANWARRSGTDVEIVSVDDSPEWLAKTGAFLRAEGLDARLIDIAGLPELPDATFELAFDDIGRIEDRARVIDPILRLMAPGGIVLLDDMNVRGYREQVRTRLDAAGWKLFSLRAQTLDPKGRFAMLTAAPRS